MLEQSLLSHAGSNNAATLLIVESKPIYAKELAEQMEERGFAATVLHNLSEVREHLVRHPDLSLPIYMVINVQLHNAEGGNENGLKILEELCCANVDIRAVIVSDHLSIPVAIAAMEWGVIDYFTKMSGADEIAESLRAGSPALPENQPSYATAEQAYFPTAFESYGKKVGETARKLKMHRRTLQRILKRGNSGTKFKKGVWGKKFIRVNPEKAYARILARFKGNTATAAEYLGVNETVFRNALVGFGIDAEKLRDSSCSGSSPERVTKNRRTGKPNRGETLHQ